MAALEAVESLANGQSDDVVLHLMHEEKDPAFCSHFRKPLFHAINVEHVILQFMDEK